MDARLMLARDMHRRAEESERLAGTCRERRNEIIRELVAEGLAGVTIARALGCSPELVSHVVRGRVGPGTRGRRPRGIDA